MRGKVLPALNSLMTFVNYLFYHRLLFKTTK